VTQSRNGGPFTTASVTSSGATGGTVTDLAASSSYTFRVVAVDALGNLGLAATAVATTAP
jgi:hypothetical protein